jgi:hypothetical protein
VQKDQPDGVEANVSPAPDQQEELDAGPDLRQHFELFRLKKEAQQKCDALLQDITYIESNQDLLALLQ